MARRKRTDTGNASTQGAAGVYEAMLAEVGVSRQREEQQRSPHTGRPLKRRRAGQQPQAEDAALQQAEHDDDDDDDDDEAIEFEDVSLPAPTVQTMKVDSDEEDDDDENVQFEDVDFMAPLKSTVAAADGNLELDLSTEKASLTSVRKSTADRRKPMTREEKQQRITIHQTHVLCLLFHAARRNQWCNDSEVQEHLRRRLTDKTVMYLNPGANLSQFGRSESLKNGLRQADAMWKTRFEKTERGLRRALWAEDAEQLRNYEPPEDMDSCMDREDFRNAAKTLQGSRDVGAQLYCALLRSAGVRTRLVCSLQPLTWTAGAPTLPKSKAKGKAKAEAKKAEKGEQLRASMANFQARSVAARASVVAAAGPPTARRRLGHPDAASYGFTSATATSSPSSPDRRSTFATPKNIRESAYPIYWVEVLDVGHQKWQPVDAVVTHSFWKPHVLEPPASDRENCMTYVVAFEADGTAKDVTRRYAKAYTAKTRRLRIESGLEDGARWWRMVLRPFSRRRREDLDQIEDNELAGIEAREPMPRNVQDFKDHPIYALERHLRRHEVLVPGATPSGTVGAGARAPLEKIYRRRDVRVARTADKWYRAAGRVVKPNEIPAKWLPPKKTRDHDGDRNSAGTPIYRLDQTEPYVAPPVRSGRVPKNKFGNIDMYVPSMVPRGGVHVDEENAGRAAFLLGIDYAPALTGFSFKGRQGTAVLRGVVVAAEHERAMREVLVGLCDLEREAELERRKVRALKSWRRFLMALRIRERVWAGVDEGERREADRQALEGHRVNGSGDGDDGDFDDCGLEDAQSDVTEEFDMVADDEDGGGYVGDDAEEYGGGGGGGFIPE
ncbi:xeroderma pigmentosum group C-complementing protein [Geosmithia morbida]|uniref:Xeroderma pigmentosum group C-complementing protein n=1 Tax=Geosmithia morbida TaxID=1094350 RepID=A0A9P4YUC6_9HYPO|nr:xeroderma pigmentosum group C-complementing protein [Geosmithia morbida]KAF4122712.1 xeroderma pigmentosum group C-complementing protein [Geosmithia morbida]